MAKSSKTNAGGNANANLRSNRPAAASAKSGTAKRATAAKTAAKSTAKRATASRQTTATGARAGKSSNQQGRQGAGPALVAIRKRQSREQIIASASAAAGIEPRTGRVFTQSLMTTLKRHIMRGATGRVDVPFLDAALWRGTQAAQKARTMMSTLLNCEVKFPARQASPVPRFRAHRALREIVARQ